MKSLPLHLQMQRETFFILLCALIALQVVCCYCIQRSTFSFSDSEIELIQSQMPILSETWLGMAWFSQVTVSSSRGCSNTFWHKPLKHWDDLEVLDPEFLNSTQAEFRRLKKTCPPKEERQKQEKERKRKVRWDNNNKEEEEWWFLNTIYNYNWILW